MEHVMTLQQTKMARANAMTTVVVDSLDPDNAFVSLETAVAWADANITAGRTVEVIVTENCPAIGVGNLTIPVGRSWNFVAKHPQSPDNPVSAVIRGTIICSDNGDGQGISFDGVTLFNFNLTLGTDWLLTCTRGVLMNAVITMRHVGAVVSHAYFDDVLWMAGSRVVEIAGAAGGHDLILKNCTFEKMLTDEIPMFDIHEQTDVVVNDCNFSIMAVVADTSLFNLNNKVGGSFYINGCHGELYNVVSFHFIRNPNAGLLVSWEDVFITVANYADGSEGVLDLGATVPVNHSYTPTISSDTQPTQCPISTVWIDRRTDEKLVWDGTYWSCGGGMLRNESIVAVGAADVASVDIGWNVPADGYVVKGALRLLKAITPDAGTLCKQVGLGIAASEDKYGHTTTLLANAVGGEVNPTYFDGASENLLVYACNVAGAPAGTIKGSIAADIRVLIWFLRVTTPKI